VALSKGAFLGVKMEGAVVGARNRVNTSFYGREVSPLEILTKNTVDIPSDKKTLMNEIHHKLKLLHDGETWEPNTEEHTKVSEAAKVADEANEKAKKEHPDIVYVDPEKAAE
jgi:hypothetical protein